MNINKFSLHIGLSGCEMVLRNLSRVALKRYREYYEKHYKVKYIYSTQD